MTTLRGRTDRIVRALARLLWVPGTISAALLAVFEIFGSRGGQDRTRGMTTSVGFGNLYVQPELYGAFRIAIVISLVLAVCMGVVAVFGYVSDPYDDREF